MRWGLHGLAVEGVTNDSTLRAAWVRSFASLPASSAEPDIRFYLNVRSEVPAPPDGKPLFRQGDLAAYYPDGDKVVIHFPRYGQLFLDLAGGVTEGSVVGGAWRSYGVLEDLLATGLSPHLRRRGMFLVHAFAAAREGRAVLLVGGIGAGKTTTGIALLDGGWRLLSNDSPILDGAAEVLSYPGVLAAYPDTLSRFAATARLSEEVPEDARQKKLTLPPGEVWPGVWIDRAQLGAICFLQIEPRSETVCEPLSSPEALRRLLPHAVEQWDREMIPRHLSVLRHAVEAAPAMVLRLGTDVHRIPALLAGKLDAAAASGRNVCA